MPEFELLEARTDNVLLPLPWRKERSKLDLNVILRQNAHPGFEKNNLTAIIGRNGSGKSHLLSAVVESFVKLEEYARGRSKKLRRIPLQLLRYRIDDQYCEVSWNLPGDAVMRVNEASVSIHNLPLPNRVVALTTSPFDKFVVPRVEHFSVAPREHSLYRYLGLRDRTGRAAVENLLFRSLNSLFETSDNEALRRANIGRVFTFLKLLPALTVVYRLRTTNKLRTALREGRSFLNEEVIGDRNRLNRSLDVLKSLEISEPEMANMLIEAMEHAQNGMLSLSADFHANRSVDPLFVRLRPLRRAGFLQLRAVEVTQSNGAISDLKRASSGQLSTVTSLLSLASEIANGSLVLIDEPELSLHPQWQVKYVDLLLQTFANYAGCHFIVATHSPLVVSELPAHATIVSLDKEELPSTEELTGESADFLLAEAFGLPTNNNRYIKDRVVTALRLAAEGKSDTVEYRREIEHLHELVADLEEDSPVREVIAGLEKAVEENARGWAR